MVRLIKYFLAISILNFASSSMAQVPDCNAAKSFIEQAVSNAPIDGTTSNTYPTEYSSMEYCNDLELNIKAGNQVHKKPFRVVVLERIKINSTQPNSNALAPIPVPDFIRHLSRVEQLNQNPALIDWQENIQEIWHNGMSFIHLSTISAQTCSPGSGVCLGGLYNYDTSIEDLRVGGRRIDVAERAQNNSPHYASGFPLGVELSSEAHFQYVNMFTPSGFCNGRLLNGQCLVAFPTSHLYRSLYLFPLTSITPTPTPTPTTTGTISPTPTATISVTPTPTPTGTITYITPTPEVCEPKEGEDSEIIGETSIETSLVAPLYGAYSDGHGNEVHYEQDKNKTLRIAPKSPSNEVFSDPKPGEACTSDDPYAGLPTLADIAKSNLNPKNYFKDLQLIGRSGIHACNLFAYSAAARYAWNLRERKIISEARYNQIVGRTRSKRGFNYSTPFAHESLASYRKRGFKCMTKSDAIKSINRKKLSVGVTLIRTPRQAKNQGHMGVCTDTKCFEASYSWKKAKSIRGYRGQAATSRGSFFGTRSTFTHLCWLPEQEPQMLSATK